MNKTKVIIFASMGLAIILTIFLFVNAGHTKGERKDNEAMTEVPQEFTYHDMMEARSSKESYSDTTETRPLTTTAPDKAAAGTADTEGGMEDKELSAQVAEINRVKDSIKVQAKRSNTANTTRNAAGKSIEIAQEDEIIRQYALGRKSSGRPERQRQMEEPFSESDLRQNIQEAKPAGKNRKAATPAVNEPFKSSMKFTYNKPGGGEGSDKTFLRAEIIKEVAVKDNETVSLLLLENATVNGVSLPRKKALSGITRISGNRVFISVPGANVNGALSNLRFSVYDNDGLEGLRVAGLDRGEAAGELKEQGIGAASGIGGGIINGVVSVVRAFGTKGQPRIMLAEGRVLLKSISLN